MAPHKRKKVYSTTKNYTTRHSSERNQSVVKCCFCKQPLRGGLISRNSHQYQCASNPNNKVTSVTTSNIERTIRNYDDGIQFRGQHTAGADVGKSLRHTRSIREIAQENSFYDDDEKNYKSSMDFDLGPGLGLGLGSDFNNIARHDDGNPSHFSSSSSEDDSWNDDDSMEECESEHSVNFGMENEEILSLPSKFVESCSLYQARKYQRPNDESINNPPEKVQYDNALTNPQIALVDLADILSDRTKTDKKLFDDIAGWSAYWANKDPNIWSSWGKSNTWTRKKLINSLTATFKCENLKPSFKEYTSLDGRRVITVPIFDWPSQIRELLDDRNVFNNENIMKGLDKKTWRPLRSADDMENDQHFMIDDKDSGYLYWMGIEQHCPGDEECDTTEILPLPLILAIDKSHYDLHGNLCVTPIGFSLAMLDCHTQQRTEAWKMGATVPNLSVKKGRNKKRKKGSSKQGLQDMHNILKIALSSLKEAYDNGGIIWKGRDGKTKILKPYIHMIIGDTAGNNELCGHYLGGKSRCLVKDCKCSFEVLHKTPPKCHTMTWKDLHECNGDDAMIFQKFDEKGLISLKTLSEIIDDEKLQKSNSYHDISNFTDGLPLSDPYLGIIGLTPQELLHVMEAGLYEHVPLAIRDVIGFRDSNAADKELIDEIFADVTYFITRNCERDVLRMANRSGFFNLTKVNGTERHGNFFAFVISMHTSYCEAIMRPHFENVGISFERMRFTSMLLLSWDRFLLDSNERWEYDDGMYGTISLMKRMKKHYPKQVREKSKEMGDGSHGWHIVKFHVMQQLMANCLKFGSARTTHGSKAENNHKTYVKQTGQQTQRRSESFATQIAQNYYENEVLKKGFNMVKKHCMPTSHRQNEYHSEKYSEEKKFYIEADEIPLFSQYEPTSNLPDPSIERFKECTMRGSYSMNIKVDRRHRITASARWKDRDKDKISGMVQPHPIIKYALGRSAIKLAQTIGVSDGQSFEVEGFTSLKAPINNGENTTYNVTFKCSPMERGREWYDFALIRMPKTKEKLNGDTCVAKILGFVMYKTKGALTFKHIMMDDKTKDEVLQSTDKTRYMIVQCEEEFTEYKDITKSFVKRIRLQSHNHIHIIPIGCIVGPLLVVPDITGRGVVSKSSFIVASGYHKWGSLFRNYCRRLRNKRESQQNHREESSNDSNESIRDDEESTSSDDTDVADDDNNADDYDDDDDNFDEALM